MDNLIVDTLLQLIPTIISGLLAYIMYEQNRRHKQAIAEQKRLNDDQNNEHKLQIQALQNENTQTQAQLEIIKEYATGTPRLQETWQAVLNTMSERRLEGDKEMAAALREIAQANRIHAQEVDDFGTILEIHTTAQSIMKKNLEDSLYTFVESARTTHDAVESQKEELELVSKSINTLTNRIDDLIALDESHVIDEGKRHDSLKDDNREHKAELVAIKDALQTSNGILEKILKRMESPTQPIPDLTDVDDTIIPATPEPNTDNPPLTSAA